MANLVFSGGDQKAVEEAVKRGAFLDTNVWLFVYGPDAGIDPRHKNYSNLVSQIMKRGGSLYIDAVVLIEFVYRILRFPYFDAKSDNPTLEYHTFKKSERYGEALKEAGDILSYIRNDSEMVDTSLKGLDLDEVFGSMANGSVDFNDKLICHTCSTMGLLLVTDDAGCASQGADLITFNWRALKKNK